MLKLVDSKVEHLKTLGSEIDIVNAARVSMGKWTDEFRNGKDDRLIKFLVKHRHYSPLRHCHIQFRMKVPLFVHAQLVKHRLGVEINTISGRYVEFDPEFYDFKWRAGSKDIKQGSLGEMGQDFPVYKETLRAAMEGYQNLLAAGVCKEQARGVLPTSLMTQCIVTMSLQAAMHFCSLRLKPDAQKEIREVAQIVNDVCEQHFPNAWEAFKEVEGK